MPNSQVSIPFFSALHWADGILISHSFSPSYPARFCLPEDTLRSAVSGYRGAGSVLPSCHSSESEGGGNWYPHRTHIPLPQSLLSTLLSIQPHPPYRSRQSCGLRWSVLHKLSPPPTMTPNYTGKTRPYPPYPRRCSAPLTEICPYSRPWGHNP